MRRWTSDTPRSAPVRPVPLRVEGHLEAAARPSQLVDAGVLGDLVDPRLERDRPLGVPKSAQGRDEHLLGDVLGAVGVGQDPAHVGADPAAIAREQLLERIVFTAPDRGHELVIAGPRNRTHL